MVYFIIIYRLVWVGVIDKFFNFSLEFWCLKDSSVGDDIGICNWNGSRYGNSIFLKCYMGMLCILR